MAVMMPREKWTDDRLDDLNKNVHHGFARVDESLRELRGELKSEAKAIRGEMNGRLDKLDTKFDRLTVGLFVSAAGIIAAMIGSNAL
jgi:hypothetical protein